MLSIEVLERDLISAERELAKATADRLRANEVENQWQIEVTSLKSLIQVRKQRINPGPSVTVDNTSDKVHELGEDYEGGFPLSDNGSNSDVQDLNKVNWIDRLIAASGTMGIAPPEIMKAAEKDHVKMHPNYPYVVLRKLVAKERAVKRRGRYYKRVT